MSVDPVELSAIRSLLVRGEARRIRQAARLSLREMAAAIGATAGTVYRWEVGRMTPRGERAIRYARLLRLLDRSDPH